jgi:hypothetical protein
MHRLGGARRKACAAHKFLGIHSQPTTRFLTSGLNASNNLHLSFHSGVGWPFTSTNSTAVVMPYLKVDDIGCDGHAVHDQWNPTLPAPTSDLTSPH